MRNYKFNNDENQEIYSFPQIKNLYYDLKHEQINLPPFLDWLDAKIRDKEITEIPEEIEISWSIKVIISDENIKDIISSVIYGDVNYWCDYVKPLGTRYGNDILDHFLRGGALAFGQNEHILLKWMLVSAINQWIKKTIDFEIYNNLIFFKNGHLEIDTHYCDAKLSDIFIQLALFDEIIYE